MPQSSDIGQKSDEGISDFRISGQSLIKENCYNSRTSDDIDMKLGPVTKFDKRNKTTSKKIVDDVMSENCDVKVIFQIFGQFEQSGGWISDTESAEVTFSVTVTFCLTKTETELKNL